MTYINQKLQTDFHDVDTFLNSLRIQAPGQTVKTWLAGMSKEELQKTLLETLGLLDRISRNSILLRD
jgi:hypothetical protein